MVSISSLCTRAKRWVHPKWVEMKRLPRLDVELTAPPDGYAKNPQTGWEFQPFRVRSYCLREVGETSGSLLWGAVEKKGFQGTIGKSTLLNVSNEIRLVGQVLYTYPSWGETLRPEGGQGLWKQILSVQAESSRRETTLDNSSPLARASSMKSAPPGANSWSVRLLQINFPSFLPWDRNFSRN